MHTGKSDNSMFMDNVWMEEVLCEGLTCMII